MTSLEKDEYTSLVSWTSNAFIAPFPPLLYSTSTKGSEDLAPLRSHRSAYAIPLRMNACSSFGFQPAAEESFT